MKHRKIKVLVITPTFPTRYNPVAAIWLFNQLKELKKHCDVKVIFRYPYVPKIKFLNPYYRFSAVKKKESFKGIEVYHPKYFMFPRILFVPRFLNFFLTIEGFISYFTSKKFVDKIMEGWNPDIIHLHGLLGDGLVGARVKRKYGKILIATLHGEDMTKFAQERLTRMLSKFTLKNVDVINSQSKFLKDKVGKLGILHKRICLIPMGANLENFRFKDKIKARKLLKLPKNKKIILFIGHLIERKAPDYLVKAMKIVSENNGNVLCCIIGKGHMESSLKNIVSELSLEDKVKFLGQKPNKEVALYLNACDVFVLPSLSEGLAVAPCEALACGKPVVATKVGAFPEIVNKDVGYLVKPKNHVELAVRLTEALNKKWNYKKILKRSRLFSVPTSAKNLAKLYEQLLDQNKKNFIKEIDRF
jgi:glycosyltransferase involved in cell wall biosynthesis